MPRPGAPGPSARRRLGCPRPPSTSVCCWPAVRRSREVSGRPLRCRRREVAGIHPTRRMTSARLPPDCHQGEPELVSRSTKVTRGAAPVGALIHSRGRIAAAALLAAGPLLTACGSGLQAQTSTERSVVDGEAAQAGDILIRYAHIDSPADPAHSQGGTALAYAAFYNGGSQPDAETSVDVVPPSGAGVSGTGPSTSPAAGTAGASTTGPATIPAGGSLLLMPDTGGHLALRGLTQPLFAGENVHLTLVFRNAGRCSFAAPVQVPSTPAPRPTPSKATE